MPLDAEAYKIRNLIKADLCDGTADATGPRRDTGRTTRG